ncbi:hypothetical protein ACFPL7_22995 [Dongia soli]|uniref:Anti sigma-E protein RseA N-terminal domain-containing protein n=1 Tax=Dongia soli TaxID=600628 RepID=A0ABU5E8H1_9PROT|nr:hypothetical protein [Dongia soli]MDY0882461.1 hypothetical protein [Dongia soli]
MMEKEFDLERDLTQAMAPVEMPASLQQRLSRIPLEHPQQSTGTVVRFQAHEKKMSGLDRLSADWPMVGTATASRRSFAWGLTSSLTAAAASLLLGVFLGANIVSDQLGLTRQSADQQQLADTAYDGTVSTDTTDNDGALLDDDNVAMIYAAADLPGVLP